uniref:Wsv063 n=1 Tax=White spot syndrome virus TaxID=92652 RepID=A0A2U9G894_WSSV|nr:wsv063 [Shrimp white spot syndrome virus]
MSMKAPRSWPILNCRLGYIASSNYPWAEHIISGDKEEIKRALEEHEKNANVRFDSDNCPVCLEDFSSTNIIRTTRCGHCIDEKCWDRLVLSTQRGEITRCPVCRERTSLRPDADQVKEMLVEPIVSCKRMAVPDEQVSCKRRRIGYNRYQFLINDVWTDESETV